MTISAPDGPKDRGRTADLLRTRFSVEAEREGDAAVVRLHGELDLATAPRLRRALGALLDTRPSALVVDLSDLTFVDTSGVRVVRAACIQAGLEGCSFTLRWPTRAVRKMLSLTGVDRLLDIEDRPSVA